MLFKRTEKYIKQNQRSTSEEAKARILQEKGSHNAERYKVLKTRIDTMLEAKLIMRGDELDLEKRMPKHALKEHFSYSWTRCITYKCCETSHTAKRM